MPSAKILVEGLKRSGKDLNNERFVTALEKLYAFDTGLTPKITYGPNRRTGARARTSFPLTWKNGISSLSAMDRRRE